MPKLTKQEIVKAMRESYMPNYFDISMFDYTKLNDEEVYEIYLNECENYSKEEINEILQEISK